MSHFSSTEKLDAMSDADFWESVEADLSTYSATAKKHDPLERTTIEDVRLDKPVELWGFINIDGLSKPVDCDNGFIMQPEQAKAFIDELIELNEVELVQETLQRIAIREDGVGLVTAFPTTEEFNSVTTHMKSIPSDLKDKLKQWEELGANEIIFDFEERL
ncbi:hypothetical protein LMH73_004750 [Vibrio splendidus]|nr:hypothetical protein [Vibrio splendidus]MCC4882538.1 hypothetical protein [Vibrio splendidus]